MRGATRWKVGVVVATLAVAVLGFTVRARGTTPPAPDECNQTPVTVEVNVVCEAPEAAHGILVFTKEVIPGGTVRCPDPGEELAPDVEVTEP